MKNENVQDRMIRQLKEEIEMLRAKLQASATAGATAGASGVSTAEADEALRLKLSEMEELQKNAWEEKERLSKQLEEERSQNMHAVMADMMHELKEQKIEHMKNLKRLQLEHETVLKKQDQTKAKSDEIRVTIMTSMKAYEKLQSTYNDMVEAEKGGASMDRDELANLTNEMATLLSNIEVDKQQWMALKEAMKGYRYVCLYIYICIYVDESKCRILHAIHAIFCLVLVWRLSPGRSPTRKRRSWPLKAFWTKTTPCGSASRMKSARRPRSGSSLS
jgi:kinesin family protein 1/kinesin family protein 3/17